MDWIDEKLDRVGRWLRNLSLRKAMAAYIMICIVGVVILYAITINLCDRFDTMI